MTIPIPTEDLAVAVAAFPKWLADDITTWVRSAEARGTQFPDTASAVDGALTAIGYRTQVEWILR